MKDMTYEKLMTRLEEIVKSLEDGTMPLDKSLELFEEATKLSTYCNACLNAAELKITQFVGSKDSEEE
ncbi:MAG: exodeoxyribonuclease VII small subunit [Oscillospiraceae bacterium]